MKHSRAIILVLILYLISGNTFSQTSKTKTVIQKKVDSNMVLLRKVKIKYPLPEGFSESSIRPLAYYNFSSRILASFSFTDSLGKVTSKTDYTYYFDKGSNFLATKETFTGKNALRTSFQIEELKDSIRFKTNLADTNRTLVYKHLQNMRQPGLKQNTVKFRSDRAYTKTGNTKMIQGFLCESLVFENDDIISTLWVALKPDAWLIKVRKDLQFSAYNELIAYTEGIVFLSECYYKQTKHKQIFEVTQVNKNTACRIVTDGNQLVRGF